MPGQSFSVINNLSSMDAQKNLYFTNIGLNKSIARLSSGLRIIDASDDAAGLAIASSLKADVYALSQAVRNANDGISIVQIADGALSKITDLLLRGVTLAEQSASDTVGTREKQTLDVEFQQILGEINRVVSVANFKGEALFGHSGAVVKSIYVGDTQFESWIRISIGASARGAGTYAMGLSNANRTSFARIDTKERAVAALGLIQKAIASVSKWRGALGAQQNRLVNAVAITQVQSLNIRAAESVISDANMAEVVVEMTRYQILAQSGIAGLAQANASSQLVLGLLR